MIDDSMRGQGSGFIGAGVRDGVLMDGLGGFDGAPKGAGRFGGAGALGFVPAPLKGMLGLMCGFFWHGVGGLVVVWSAWLPDWLGFGSF